MQTRLVDVHAHFLPFEDTPVEVYVGRTDIPRALLYALKKEVKLPYVKAAERLLRLFRKKYRLSAAYEMLTASLDYQIEALYSRMKKAGVSSAAIQVIDLNPLDNPDFYGTGAPSYPDIVQRYGEAVTRSNEAHPEGPQIYLYLGVDPRRKGILDLMEKHLAGPDSPYIGVKFYPKLGWRVNDHKDSFWYSKTLWRIYHYLTQMGVPFMTHGSNGGLSGPQGLKTNLDEWMDVFFDFPDLRGCIGHAGGCAAFVRQDGLWKATERLAMEHEGAYFGLSFHEQMVLKPKRYQGVFLNVMSTGVADKVVWGSDWPLVEIYYSYVKLCSMFRKIAGRENLEIVLQNTSNLNPMLTSEKNL